MDGIDIHEKNVPNSILLYPDIPKSIVLLYCTFISRLYNMRRLVLLGGLCFNTVIYPYVLLSVYPV